MKAWFLVSVGGLLNVEYVIYADSAPEACKSVANLSQYVTAIELTWSEIAMRLGCIIPNGKDSANQAYGSLTFNRGNKTTSLWPFNPAV